MPWQPQAPLRSNNSRRLVRGCKITTSRSELSRRCRRYFPSVVLILRWRNHDFKWELQRRPRFKRHVHDNDTVADQRWLADHDGSWDAPVATRASRLRNLIFKFGQGKTGGQP